jgi:8-oxo-dGTP diphosphatase
MAETKIGCEAWIVRDGKVLLLKRGDGDYAGTWSLPGGHLEYLERVDVAMARELKEELDLVIAPASIQPIAITDDLRPQLNQHYVHITFSVRIGNQEPKRNEPDKCAELGWFALDELPENLFPFQAKIFKTLQAQRLYVNEG